MTVNPFSRDRVRRAVALCLAAVVTLAEPEIALSQGNRDQALTALRSAANAGDAHAQLALGSLLDRGGTERDDEALQWYEKAARSGDRVAQRRYLDMLARPARKASATPRSFMIRLPRNSEQGDSMEQPADLPPGYHCHFLGHGQMWCHGGSDANQ
jgi:TPR repeat protein